MFIAIHIRLATPKILQRGFVMSFEKENQKRASTIIAFLDRHCDMSEKTRLFMIAHVALNLDAAEKRGIKNLKNWVIKDLRKSK